MINLQRFIDRVQSQDLRGQKDFIMSMGEAKAMHADLTRLLLEFQTLKQASVQPKEEVVTVSMDGGSFK